MRTLVMNLETARELIRTARQRMDELYLKPVFDEWAIAKLAGGRVEILHYEGAREEKFAQQFHRDSAPLFAAMQDKHYAIGDFEFSLDARGSHFDACVRVGEHTYCFCNNTGETVNDIRTDARWLKAQKPFLDFTERFRADPLV